jgi:hypothetical protein
MEVSRFLSHTVKKDCVESSIDSWRTFWKMILNTLKSLDITQRELESRFKDSRWPLIPPETRPPTHYVLDKIRPILEDFRHRREREWRWLDGLEGTLSEIDGEVARLSQGLKCNDQD